MVNSVHFSSATDEWATPAEIVAKYGIFDLDPCATSENAKAPRYFTREQDGLKQVWTGRVWMNPPYGREIGKWVKKASECGCEVICLLPARTDTRWFHDYCLPFGKIEFLRGRIKFGNSPHPAPFPSMIVIFNA
jgi:site-specific DNA-methyltransferase (adenine-specific)